MSTNESKTDSSAEDAITEPNMEIDTSEHSTTKAIVEERKYTTPSPSVTSQDTHPYARGSVIEVWHIDKKHDTGEDWWSDPDSDEEEGDAQKTVRLCDIIDRAQNGPNGTWRYYVHYKDFNRRMDEWVATDRIVSPPSVGNAKARALKKEEERKKRIEQRKQEEQAAVVDVTAPRSRRRTSAVDPSLLDASEGPTSRTRRRRKTAQDDDVTVVTANQAAAEEEEEKQTQEKKETKKEVVALPTDAVTTHTVGEHVVATVKAQELDEHEGLDEDSLREHEEVTKVKNVEWLQLGK